MIRLPRYSGTAPESGSEDRRKLLDLLSLVLTDEASVRKKIEEPETKYEIEASKQMAAA